MATSVLRPPDSVQNGRDPGSASPRPHTPAGGGSRGPGGGSRGVTRARLAALIAAAAATGTLAGTGVLLATGTLHTGATATVVERTAAALAATSAGGSTQDLDASAVHATAAPGVVHVVARGVSSDADFGLSGTASASGTGFVTDRSGQLVTAAHVVDGAASIQVTFPDGAKRMARLVGHDDATDLAVLR